MPFVKKKTSPTMHDTDESSFAFLFVSTPNATQRFRSRLRYFDSTTTIHEGHKPLRVWLASNFHGNEWVATAMPVRCMLVGCVRASERQSNP